MIPRISVVFPCYNSEKFLAESIESILNQTYTDFELIILNDGSTDRSKEIIHSYHDNRIIYVENSCNLRVVKTLNKGLALSKGEFIARMDSDDIAYPDRFQIQIDYLDSHLDVGMVGSWMDCFPTRQGEGHHKEFITYFDILKGWCINHPTVMIRKEVLDKFDLYYYDEYKGAEDYELWSRLIRYTKIINIQKSLIRYRWHESNVSGAQVEDPYRYVNLVKRNMLNFLTADPKCQMDILNSLYLSPKVLQPAESANH